MNAIRWVFFDIGSTLVDEEEAYRAMHTADFKLQMCIRDSGRKEHTHAKNEQETAAGMVFFPAASKSREYHLRPYHIQRPLPGLYT